MHYLYHVVIPSRVIKYTFNYVVRYDNTCIYGGNMHEFEESDPFFIARRKMLHSNDFNKVFMDDDKVNVMIVSNDILKYKEAVSQAILILSDYINDGTIQKEKRARLTEARKELEKRLGNLDGMLVRMSQDISKYCANDARACEEAIHPEDGIEPFTITK